MIRNGTVILINRAIQGDGRHSPRLPSAKESQIPSHFRTQVFRLAKLRLAIAVFTPLRRRGWRCGLFCPDMPASDPGNLVDPSRLGLQAPLCTPRARRV